MLEAAPVRGRPLYEQVRDAVISLIAKGRWRPGQVVPNEGALCAEFKVSIGTLRRAMELVEAEGLIARRQGKGTFVTEPASGLSLGNIRDSGGKRIGNAFKTLAHEVAEADATERARLQLEVGAKVLREARLRCQERDCVTYESRTTVMERLPALSDGCHGTASLQAIALRSGVLLGKATEWVEPVQLTTNVANHLRIKPKSLGLKIDRVIYSCSGEPLQWRVAFVAPGEFRYLVEFGRTSSADFIEVFLKDLRQAKPPATLKR